MNKTLLNAYLTACYRVEIGGAEKEFRVGETAAWLDELLQENNAFNAAFLSAANPSSQVLSEQENRIRNDLLRQDLQTAGYAFLSGYATDESESWPREASYLIFNLPGEKAEILATAYRQNAYLWLEKTKPVALVLTRFK